MYEKALSRSFYDRPTEEVAKNLLGKILMKKIGYQYFCGKIVETEAYLGEHDAAAHAFAGRTKRTKILYGPPGHAYIFRLRAYHCLNVSAEPEGKPGCVLIRALEPLNFFEHLRKNRKKDEKEKIENLCNGPGKLCQALEINLQHYGLDLTSKNSEIYISDNIENVPLRVVVTKRIGITKAGDWQQRYIIDGNSFVSGNKKINYGKILELP